MDLPGEVGFAVPLAGWGVAWADLPEVAAWRRVLPPWAPAQTPAHFLKHADEQTVVAVAAVDRVIEQGALPLEAVRQWPIVAAPQCVGRIAGAATLGRFARGGAPTVSPHLIPQHSLHSISGALSILLSSRAPNLGISGGAGAVEEGLLGLLTLMAGWNVPGAWLVGTAMEPEPQLSDEGQCINQPRAWAVALALDRQGAAAACGQLVLHLARDPSAILASGGQATRASLAPTAADAAGPRWAELARQLEAAQRSGRPLQAVWTLSTGVRIELATACPSRAARAAA
jgi:hypothetical protein